MGGLRIGTPGVWRWIRASTRITKSLQVVRDLWQNRGIIDGGRHSICNAIRDLLDRAPNDLARASLRKALDDGGCLEAGHGSDSVPHQLHQFRDQVGLVPLDSRLEHD